MRDGLVLAVVCLILIGAVYVFWRSPAQVYGPLVGRTVSEPAQPAKKTDAKAVGAASKPKTARVARLTTSAPATETLPLADLESSSVLAPPAPPVHAAPPRPFPEGARIAPGLHEEAITKAYGDPALSAVTSTGSHVFETFVYAKDQGRLATVIRVEDGKVSSAFSQREPIQAAGLSAPRRWVKE